jgi:hypothetical protein
LLGSRDIPFGRPRTYGSADSWAREYPSTRRDQSTGIDLFT